MPPPSGSAVAKAPLTQPSWPNSGSRRPACTTTSQNSAFFCAPEPRTSPPANASRLSPSSTTRLTAHSAHQCDITIQTEIAGKKGSVIISIEEWQARIQACGALVKLIDRKAKLLGMDAAVRTEPPPSVASESEEQRARAREALRVWTRFAVDPKDFGGKNLS